MINPEEVFTPRSAEVNDEMYVPRHNLEEALRKSLRGNLHILIHGESGTGKSWLYKKTLTDLGVPFIVANLANASRLGSIAAELKNLVDREGDAVKTSYEEGKAAEVRALVARADISHTGQYVIGQMEPFEACLANLHKHTKNSTSVLVFDNLEAAFTEPLLKELADLLILCDDGRYSKYKVKILIVGVPGSVKEYFYKTPHRATVANRLVELPEVARLEQDECKDLVLRGLVGKLGYLICDQDNLVKHIAWITDRVPQMVHEYCLKLSHICGENKSIKKDEISIADAEWLSESQYYGYSVIESHMNERDTKAGRRNQTLFALSLCEGEQFKAPEVEEIVRREFPISTDRKILNLPQMLSQLAAGDRPLVKRSPKGDAYTFSDPKYRMVLRAMLKKEFGEKIEKQPISR
jgi:hypothetical protein